MLQTALGAIFKGWPLVNPDSPVAFPRMASVRYRPIIHFPITKS